MEVDIESDLVEIGGALPTKGGTPRGFKGDLSPPQLKVTL